MPTQSTVPVCDSAAAAFHPDDLSQPNHPYNQKPQPKVWPGAGWRWVQVGEALQKGDEVVFTSLPGHSVYEGQYGTAVKEGPDGAFPFGYYRRKIDPSAPAKPGVSPGPGFRFLAPGETSRPRYDSFVYPCGTVAKCIITATVESANHYGSHIVRKLPRKPPGTPPAGYRFVEEFEVLKDTDRYRWNGTFHANYNPGMRLGTEPCHNVFFTHDEHYLRPLEEAKQPEAAKPAAAQPSPKCYPKGTPPAGYRRCGSFFPVLDVGERLGSLLGHAVGETAGEQPEFDKWPAVRPIPVPSPAAKPAPRLPSGTPPAGYRFLAEGEIVQRGDVYLFKGKIHHTREDFTGAKVGDYPSDFEGEPWVRKLPEAPKSAQPIPLGYRELAPGEIIRRTDLYCHAHDKTWRLRAGTVRCGTAYAPTCSALALKQRPHSLTVRRDWSVDPTSFPRFKSIKGIVYHDAPGTALKFVPHTLKPGSEATLPESSGRCGLRGPALDAGTKVISVVHVYDNNDVDFELAVIPQPEADTFASALQGFSYHDFAGKDGAS